ncbi:hypothetical protein F5Y15DRAFT_375722 [Xylariaceae sp. FL0016]|nr:hypothetical protein F5Y15DRAFT_375722 [Xylariaceae sp. FL0016]
MTIDLCGPAGCFGQMSLPEFKTHPLGAPIIVNNQVVNITDATALQAFIGPMMRKKEAVLCLRNGSANMAALGIGPRAIRYEKDVPMPGMRGPFVSVFSASIPMPESPAQDGMSPTRLALDRLKPNIVNVTLHISNPSALEISFGTCVFEIQNSQGEVFVEDLKGRLDIRNNAFEAAFQGIVHRRVVMREGQARLVGKRCAGAGWCDETIKSINVSLSGINKVLRVLVAQHHNEGSSSIGEDDKLYDIEESDDVAGLTRWTSKIFRRRKV